MPTKFPSTESARPAAMPTSPFPETRFPAAGAAPPIVLPPAPVETMPSAPLPRARVPESSVPTRFPSTTLPLPSIRIPAPVLPETTLRTGFDVPPIRLRSQRTRIPIPRLPGAAPPARSVPMKLPCTTLPPFSSSTIAASAVERKRKRTSPRTALDPAVMRRPAASSPAAAPSTATMGDPFQPGCFVASRTTESAITGSGDVRRIVTGPEPTAKRIVSGPGCVLENVIASRSVQGAWPVSAQPAACRASSAFRDRDRRRQARRDSARRPRASRREDRNAKRSPDAPRRPLSPGYGP